jgi:hypothetical protein
MNYCGKYECHPESSGFKARLMLSAGANSKQQILT